MPTSRFFEKEGLCGGPLDNCNGDSSSPSFKVGEVSIVLIMIILYCTRHPFEMEQNKERKSMDSYVYFPPKERISSQDLIEATITFHEMCAYGGTVYKAVMHSGQAITVKKLTSNREGSNIDNIKEPIKYFQSL